MEVKKVIFPVDWAGSSYRVARKVRSILDMSASELHLVSVLENFEGYNTFFVPHPSLDLLERDDEEYARKHLKEFAEEYFVDSNPVIAVLRGDPADQIGKYIVSHKIDLVVLAGQRASSFLERAIFGNINDRIAKNSPAPVIVIDPFADVSRILGEQAA